MPFCVGLPSSECYVHNHRLEYSLNHIAPYTMSICVHFSFSLICYFSTPFLCHTFICFILWLHKMIFCFYTLFIPSSSKLIIGGSKIFVSMIHIILKFSNEKRVMFNHCKISWYCSNFYVDVKFVQRTVNFKI